MTRIVRIELDGFKSQHDIYDLRGPTLLSGANGLGKSAVMEGLRYAVSGEVPDGRSLEVVERYFRGAGHVEVVDEAGHSIARGLRVEKKSLRQYCVVDGEELGSGDDSEEWHTNLALLDMRSFLARSANKRREFILNLIGAGTCPDVEEIEAAVAGDYAREIGGVGASADILSARIGDLPEELQSVAARWKSVWEVLSSFIAGAEESASALFQRLTDESRERKNSSRHAAQKAEAATKELEHQARGARAAAAELGALERDLAEAEKRLEFAESRDQKRRYLMRRVKDACRDAAHVAEQLAAAEKRLAESDPGPEPAEWLNDEAAELAPMVEEARRDFEAAEEVRRHAEALRVRAAQLKVAQEHAEEALEELDRQPLAELSRCVRAMRRLPTSDGLPTKNLSVSPHSAALGALLEAADAVCESWAGLRDRAQREADDAMAAYEKAAREAEEAAAEALSEDEVAELARRVEEAREAHQAAVDRFHAGREKRAAEIRRWRSARDLRESDRVLAERHRGRQEALAAQIRDLEAELDSLEAEDPAPLRDAAEALRRRVGTAREAAAAATAHETAVRAAEDARIDEAAWEAAEAACRRSREIFVADVAAPLCDDIQALLRAAGRTEEVYLTLEGPRGKAVFDLGWKRDGAKISLATLSRGEAVIFTCALALAFARRAEGRKILMLDAAPLNDANFDALLDALATMRPELDACIVETHREIEAREGWDVVRFGQEEP